jgi:predicted aspartyl protease
MRNKPARPTVVSPMQNTPSSLLDHRTPGASVRSTLLTALAALGLCHCAPRPAPSSTITEPGASPEQAALARFKQATGGAAWDTVHTLHADGTLEAGGLTGSIESFDDLPTGRNVSSFRLGPISGSAGFDGASGWSRDQSGSVHVTDAPQARAAVVSEAYRAARAYWYPERMPAAIRLDRTMAEGERRFSVLHVAPSGGRPYEMWLDAESGLLDRVVEQGDNEITTTFYGDYRRVGALLLPHAIRVSTGDPAYDNRITLAEVRVGAAEPAQRYAMPANEVTDVEIAGGRDTLELPFELHNNHIYVQARINGKEPVRVLVDTGGVNLLTPQAATALGVAFEGAMEARGAGEESVDLALAKVDSLGLGDATLRDQVFYVIDLGRLEDAEGIPFAGLVGFEVFKRFAVTIDYADRRLTLVRPERFEYRGNGTAVPFVFQHRIPQIQGTLDGIPGAFTIDTGSRSSLTLHAPFVAEHELQAKYAPTVEAMSGWGVGGPVRSHRARGGTLVLGEVAVPGVALDLFTGERGAFAAKHVAGNIGGGVLARFTVTFDYARQRMYLEKNRLFDQPDTHDRSGLWINRAGGAFTVEDVVPGSPAAQAGVRVGDRITAVDGQAAAGLSLADTRARWRGAAPGTRVRLRIENAQGSRAAELVLRDL